QYPSGVLAGLDARVGRQLPAGGQERHAVQERLDVGAAEPGRIPALIGPAGAQGPRRAPQRADDLVEPGPRLLAAPARQIMSSPAFGGLTQPVLADAGEGEPAVMPQNCQIPPVL